MWIIASMKEILEKRRREIEAGLRYADELQTSCPGGLIWYMQKLWSSKEHASGQKNNPWKQDRSDQSHKKTEDKLELSSMAKPVYNIIWLLNFPMQQIKDINYIFSFPCVEYRFKFKLTIKNAILLMRGAGNFQLHENCWHLSEKNNNNNNCSSPPQPRNLKAKFGYYFQLQTFLRI